MPEEGKIWEIDGEEYELKDESELKRKHEDKLIASGFFGADGTMNMEKAEEANPLLLSMCFKNLDKEEAKELPLKESREMYQAAMELFAGQGVDDIENFPQ